MTLSADAQVKPELLGFAEALNGHTTRKASILRAAHLERRTTEETNLGQLFAPLPEKVERTSEHARPSGIPRLIQDRQQARISRLDRRIPNTAESPASQPDATERIAANKNSVQSMYQKPPLMVLNSEKPAVQSKPYSPLMSLPPELRNMIWRLLLIDCEPIDLTAHAKAANVPATLQVCRQIRQEAFAMYYSGNDFVATVKDANTAYVCCWLDVIGVEGGSHLRRLEIRCSWAN